MRKKLTDNITEDHKLREDSRVEREMLEELVKVASFGEIPKLLIDSEQDKMIHELEHSIGERGVEWLDYLKTINKTENDLRSEFKDGAINRVKFALINRAVAQLNNLEAEDAEVEADIAKALDQYSNDERVATQLSTDDYREYTRNILTNRKVIEWLKEKLVK